jgi:hypothetical protein
LVLIATGMQIAVTENFAEIRKRIADAGKQNAFATSVALNKTAEVSKQALRSEMPRVFDRPTPWVLNSLRIKYARKDKLSAELAYKDKSSVESARSMLEPQVDGGGRRAKVMELRLNRIGLLPVGWQAVPGAAAQLDKFGNLNRGQITLLLNVIGAYTEAGYNKANAKTVARLAAGGRKSSQYGQYGYAWLVNPVSGSKRIKHLKPGIFQRVATGFGSSLRPILMFVRTALYKKRFNFYGIVQKVVNSEFSKQFDAAHSLALRTARV